MSDKLEKKDEKKDDKKEDRSKKFVDDGVGLIIYKKKKVKPEK